MVITNEILNDAANVELFKQDKLISPSYIYIFSVTFDGSTN